MRTFLLASLCFWLPCLCIAVDVRQPTAPNWPTNYPVNGTVSVSNFPASQPVTGVVSVSNLPSVQSVSFAPATTSTITVVASFKATVSQLVVGPNAARKALFLYNNSSNSMYVAYDSVSNSATHMTFVVPTFSTWVMPTPIWQGPISAVRNAGDGTVLVTEMQ